MGGLTEARRIQAFAAQHGVGCWCGGMVDAGVARGHNLAVASLPNYIYANDIVTPSTYISRNATITLSERPGTGFEPAANVIDRHTVAKWAFLRSSR